MECSPRPPPPILAAQRFLGPREAYLPTINESVECSPSAPHLSLDRPHSPTSVTDATPWLKPRPSTQTVLTSSRATLIAASTGRLLGKSPRSLSLSPAGAPPRSIPPNATPVLPSPPPPATTPVPTAGNVDPIPPALDTPSRHHTERDASIPPAPDTMRHHTERGASSLPPLADTGIPPSVLLYHIDQALAWRPPPLRATSFQFDWSDDAAAHNLQLLAEFDYDLGRAIAAQPGSIVTPGCEFRPTSLLRSLCSRHPLWPRAAEWLTTGVTFPSVPIAEDARLEDLHAMIARGNHQSAKQRAPTLEKMMRSEVRHGWQLPLPPAAALLIPGAIVAPMGLIEQATINELGEIIDKLRVTHDQSYNPIKRTRRSVNDRVHRDLLTPCMFGRSLLRHIHQIVALRHRYPTEPILQSKVDWKSAYRRLHNAIATAIAAMVLVGNFLLIALRLTFGGAPNPSRWSDLSEISCDLSNDLVRNPGWDPTRHFSPHSTKLPTSPILEPPDVPFAPAEPLSVPLPIDDAPKSEVYIDDLFNCYLLRHLARGSEILPFVLHLLGRPPNPADPIERDDVLSISKFLAEATPSEVKTILGWVVDTRRLLLSLPTNKVVAWSTSIQAMLDDPSAVTYAALDTLIGRLNHCGFLIPQARHFMGRIRTAKHHASKRRHTRLSSDVQLDLELWLAFLASAGEGISMNNLTFRHPTHVSRADACEHGLGGYSLVTGKAWRLELPVSLRLRASLNSLEHLASYIQLAFEVAENGLPPSSVILTGTDSTTAAGWLHHSSFDDSSPDSTPLRLWVARATAQLLLDHSSVLFSKWFPGKENEVADSLSRDHHITNDDLHPLLHSSFPEQMPQDFKICPLPRALSLQVMTWLHKLPPSSQSPKVPTRSAIGTSHTTPRSSSGSNSITTPSSTPSNPSVASASSVPSPTPTATEDFPLLSALIHEHQVLVATPSTLWLRPTGLTGVAAPATTQPENSQNFYRTS
jgi:hypothetical protein